MNRVAILLIAFCASTSFAQDDVRATLFRDTDQVLEAARNIQADMLAPIAFERGMDRYQDAEEDYQRGRNIERIRSDLTEASRFFNQAIESAEIAAVNLASLLKTRDDATNADASTFAPELWTEAEEVFEAATRLLESSDSRQAATRRQEAETLYRDAELTAIKAQYLSQTRALLAQAVQFRVPRYAPKTFSRAQDLLAQAERELNENRYDTDLPRSLAQQANYEARHAIFLSDLIQRVRDEDLTEEDIILDYEAPLTRVAAAADMVAALDRGTDSIAVDLVEYIESLREHNEQSALDLADSRTRIAELEDEIRELDEQLGGVSQERVALVQRLEAEARIRQQFASIEGMFLRDEARVSREGNTILLRLVGLTFESGTSEVSPDHLQLLQKVAQATAVFPRSQIVIEGHTDSYGSDDNNLNLSRERADAVSNFLTTELAVPQFRISAVGYGETQPIANNETPQGRARNRRIDVKIEPQLE